MGNRGPRLLALGAAALLLHGCPGPNGGRSVRTVVPATGASLDPAWARARLREAVRTVHAVLARDGAEGLLRLRLRPDEIDAMFTPNGTDRIARLPTGLSPSPGEQRWHMFAVLADSPLVGYCARGARMVEANGPEGFRAPAFVVERLLLIGSEHDGLWGAWVEGLVLTAEGWRLLPTVPFERQVETPRRDHTDVQLWDCDVGHAPERDLPL
jgi:hypothetical protein